MYWWVSGGNNSVEKKPTCQTGNPANNDQNKCYINFSLILERSEAKK